MSKSPLHSILVKVPADLHAQFKAAAKDDERTVAQAVRFAMKQYVEERAPREAVDG